MTLEELLKAYEAKLKAAQDLANTVADETSPNPDTLKQIDALLGESDELKARIDLAERLQKGQDFLAEPAGTKAAFLGWRQAGKEEGVPDVDPLSWRSMDLKTLYGPITIRYQVPLAVQQKGYDSAFEAYARKGIEYVGPNDRKTLTEAVDSAGGYLAPEQWQMEMLKKIMTTAAVRPLARVITTSRDVVKWPRITYTTDDKYTSGVRFTWTGESPASATVHRVTDPVFGLHSIPVHTAMASMPISNDLLEDSAFDVAGIGTSLIGEAFALGEDNSFVNGDGSGQPFGMLTRVTVGTELITSVVSGSASAFTSDGIIDLFYALPAQYRRNARFLMSSDAAKGIRKLKDASDRYIWDQLATNAQGGLAGAAVQDSLLGAGVVYDEFMPVTAADAYAALFGDFTGYFICDRVGMSIQRLSEIYAELNVTLLLARRRVGGDVLEPWRFRVQQLHT